MTLKHHLSLWDGKTVGSLKDTSNGLDEKRLTEIANLCADPDPAISRAASWVFKDQAEKGRIAKLPVAALNGVSHWEVALHLLQSVRHLRHPPDPQVFDPFLDHPKTIVRVWALDAYVRSGGAQADTRIAAALDDPSAAMRARAKNLLRK